MSSPSVPTVALLCGPKRVGKTTLCQRWVRDARQEGWRVGGILAPARWDDQGNKTGIDVVDLTTDEQRLQATIVPRGTDTTVGEYRLCPSNTQWALERMLRALGRPLDLVVIDEMGRLELLQGGGYAPALDAIANAACQRVLIIVRDGLADCLSDRLAPLPCRRIDVSLQGRETLSGRGLALLR